MPSFAAEFDAAAALLDEQFGETIVYHRGAQSLTVTGVVRGFHAIEQQVLTRSPSKVEMHLVDWTVQLSQLADLVDDDGPDWIEDAAGDLYTVMPVEGDQGWEYASPDRLRVRIRTFPNPDADAIAVFRGGLEVRADWDGIYTYTGTAPVGSAESAAVWEITRIRIASDGTAETAVASNVAWLDRLTETYA